MWMWWWMQGGMNNLWVIKYVSPKFNDFSWCIWCIIQAWSNQISQYQVWLINEMGDTVVKTNNHGLLAEVTQEGIKSCEIFLIYTEEVVDLIILGNYTWIYKSLSLLVNLIRLVLIFSNTVDWNVTPIGSFGAEV